MADLYDMENKTERFILLGVATTDGDDTRDSLEELSELVKTAGAKTAGILIQNREHIHPGTYIGKGKIEEVREAIVALNATGVVCDDELSPAQLRNLEDALDTKIIDRTVLILDIFASRATTKEGKLQVELAQLRYRSTRLIGLGHVLSRLGGGIGTRGPGEKKLEADRRLIRERISHLKKELAQMIQNREVARNQRSTGSIPVIAIVGYTNAGKSTLLNRLTNAGVLEEDKLFATLDPTTRSFTLESGQQILFTDTVGFIRKLPHHLIDAFRSTLEEAKYADLILHLVDSSNPNADKQMYTVYQALKNLGIRDKTIITAFNKQDREAAAEILKDFQADRCVRISAKTGQGMECLLAAIEELLNEQKTLIERVVPYSEAGVIQSIRKYGQLLEESYQEDGVFIRAYVPKHF